MASNNNKLKSSDLFRGIRTLRTVMDKEGKLHKLCIQEKYLLYTLATFANPDGSNIYPGMQLLIEATGWGKSAIFKWIGKLEEYQLLIPDGRHRYTRKFRLNIPGITPASVATSDKPDLTDEEWESQFLTDEDLAAQGIHVGLGGSLEDNGPGSPPDQNLEEEEDKEATQPRLPAVRPPDRTLALVAAAYQPPPATPPPIVGRLPAVVDSMPPAAAAEKLERDIGVMRESLNLFHKGLMSREIFMRGGRRKGFSDEFLEWMLRGGNAGSPVTTPNEPAVANRVPGMSTYQTGMYQS